MTPTPDSEEEMSEVRFEDAAWRAIMEDPRLSSARKKLSFHELRLIINHVRSALPTPPEDRS